MATNGIDFAEVVNLVNDPEPRISQNGSSRATFRAAYNPRERDRQSGDYKDGETTWISVTAFGALGDHVVQTLQKGDRALVKGRLGTRRYTDNNGTERESLDLVVDAIGPDLRWVAAQVERSQKGAGAPNNGGQAQWAQPPANGAQNGGQDFGGAFESTPF